MGPNRIPFYCRATYSHTLSDWDNVHMLIHLLYTALGQGGNQRKPTQAWGEHVNSI